MTGPEDSRAPGRRWSYDFLRIVVIVGVVGIHSLGAVIVGGADRSSKSWWLAVALDLGFIWAVPAFVMLSGALVLDPRQHVFGPAAFYRRRLVRLAPAFVFWQLFYLVVVRGAISGEGVAPAKSLELLLQGKAYTHLYFLWLIAGLYLVAPILAAFLHTGGARRSLKFVCVAPGGTVAVYASASVLTFAGQSTPILLRRLV